MLDLIRRYAALYLVEVLGFCLMGNHFHILVRVIPESTDFGLREFNPPADKCHKSIKERIRRYRRYVYEAGSLNQSAKGSVKAIEDKVIEKERSKEFELSKTDRFRYRTRYFTDSGIIGSKEFISTNYQRFKNLFKSKHEKKPKPVKGLDGIYSLKRLSEVI
jgi:putative transposase